MQHPQGFLKKKKTNRLEFFGGVNWQLTQFQTEPESPMTPQMARNPSENTPEGWNTSFGSVVRPRASKTATGLGGFFSGVFSSNLRHFFFLDNGRYLCYSNQEKPADKFKKIKGVIDLAILRQSPYSSTYGISGRPHGTKEILLHYGEYEINLECKDSQEQQAWIGHIEGVYNRLQLDFQNGIINPAAEVSCARGEYKSKCIPPTLLSELLSQYLKALFLNRDSLEGQDACEIVRQYFGDDMGVWANQLPTQILRQRVMVSKFGLSVKKTEAGDLTNTLKQKLGLASELKPVNCLAILVSSRNLVVLV